MGGVAAITNTDVEDSDASGGQLIVAGDGTGTNSGNNLSGASSAVSNRPTFSLEFSGNWSNASNWAFVSGGTGGAGAPSTVSQNAIFDGNGLGNCTIDTTVNINSFTVSSTPASGFTGSINTSSNAITFAGGFTMSTGTFNALGSTITVNGDVNLNAGTFNAGASSITVSGNWTRGFNSAVYNSGTEKLILTGSNKTFIMGDASLANLQIPGTINMTLGNGGASVLKTFNMAGTLTLISGGISMLDGSTATVSRSTLNGTGGSMIMNDSAVLNASVPISAPVTFQTNTKNVVIPSGTYNGLISAQNIGGNNLSAVLGAGAFFFNGGLQNFVLSHNLVVDGSVNNPSINVTTLTFITTSGGTPSLNAGTGTWTVSNLFSMSTGTFIANSALITFSSSVVMSTGTFNASSSSITVNGDMTISAGVFNAGGSTVTIDGNLAMSNPLAFNSATSLFSMNGTGKVINLNSLSSNIFWNINIPGSITLSNQYLQLNGIGNVARHAQLLSRLSMSTRALRLQFREPSMARARFLFIPMLCWERAAHLMRR